MRLRPRKPEPTEEAVNARRRAERAAARASALTPVLEALANDLREIQKRNHLAEAFEHALRGSP